METKKTFSVRRRTLLLGAGAMTFGALAFAQKGWPTERVITWLVPYPAGGSADVLGRNLAQKIAAPLGTNVVVDNRAGATGTIGAAYVARSKADGYTLLGTSIGPQAIVPHLLPKLPYSPIDSFEPVINIGTIPHILVVGAAQPFHSVEELVAAAKAQPGSIAFASGGNGTILQMQSELLSQKAGIEMIHVPYQGDTPALQDVLGSQVHFMFAPSASVLPHVKAGKLRALAVTSASRLEALPEVVTMQEAGYQDFVVEQWHAVFAPAGTPAEIVERLNQEINTALKDQDLIALAERLGITLVGGTPEQLGMLQRADFSKWGEVIKSANIRLG